MQVTQCQHHRRTGALAAQESRFARRAEHERIERIVQGLAELDAEIGGGAMEHFAARVVQRDRAITRVRNACSRVLTQPGATSMTCSLSTDARMVVWPVSDEAEANVD